MLFDNNLPLLIVIKKKPKKLEKLPQKKDIIRKINPKFTQNPLCEFTNILA